VRKRQRTGGTGGSSAEPQTEDIAVCVIGLTEDEYYECSDFEWRLSMSRQIAAQWHKNTEHLGHGKEVSRRCS
jgi:hypothetical protein